MLILIPKYRNTIIPKKPSQNIIPDDMKKAYFYLHSKIYVVLLGNFSNISFNNTNSEYFCEETVVTIAFVSLLIQWLMLPFGVLIVCLDMKYEPLGQIRNHSLQSRLQSTVNRRPNRRPNQQDYGTLITNPDENTISIETNPLP